METELEYPADVPPSKMPHESTYTPEFTALAGLLRRREVLQDLSVELLRQNVIKQDFLRRFMETLLDAWFDLEEKTEQALRASGNHRSMAAEALIKANNAVNATDVCLKAADKIIEMGLSMTGIKND